jgi:hypothetical protein
MMHFEADHRCPDCRKLVLTEHEIFLFYNCPDTIRLHPGEGNAEWQPCPETSPIPMDDGPNRVAYVWGGDTPRSILDGVRNHLDHIGEPVVQVFEGPLADILWVPCMATSLESNPGVWQWLCQPIAPRNPSTNEWMLSISS